MHEIVNEVRQWMIAAGETIKDNLNKEDLVVETKSGPVSYTHLTLPTTPYV